VFSRNESEAKAGVIGARAGGAGMGAGAGMGVDVIDESVDGVLMRANFANNSVTSMSIPAGMCHRPPAVGSAPMISPALQARRMSFALIMPPRRCARAAGESQRRDFAGGAVMACSSCLR
jgi:hypothetical protein